MWFAKEHVRARLQVNKKKIRQRKKREWWDEEMWTCCFAEQKSDLDKMMHGKVLSS